MFFRRKPVVSNEAYGRWLRAQRPSKDVVPFFLLTPDEQETLALIGDEYVQDVVIAIGYAVNDPQAAEAGLGAVDDLDSEGDLLQRVIGEAVRRFKGQEPQQPAGPSFAGLGARKKQQQAQECHDVASTATFMGRPPDEVVPKESA